MIRVFDKKIGEDISIKEGDLRNHLYLHPERYVPARDESYYVKDTQHGGFEVVKGDVLYKTLSQTKRLVSGKEAMIGDLVNQEGNKVLDFVKGGINEALFLGMGDTFLTDGQKQKSAAMRAGEITGMIAPFLAGPIAGAARLAGKNILKQGAKKTLKAVSKAPIAQVARVADRAGIAASKAVGKAFGKKSGFLVTPARGAARAVATGTTWGAATGAAKAIEAGVANNRTGPKTPEGEQARVKMSSALAEGSFAFGETALATSVLMGGFGAVGKAIGLAGKGITAAPSLLRKRFFGVSGFKDMEKLRVAMGWDTKMFRERIKDEAVLRTASLTARKIGESIGAKEINTKDQFISALQKFRERQGGVVGGVRKRTAWQPAKARKAIDGILRGLYFEIPEIARRGNLKPYADKLVNVSSSIKKIQTFDFKNLKIIRDEFNPKAAFNKDAPSGIQKAYRRAYTKFTDLEDEATGFFTDKLWKGKENITKAIRLTDMMLDAAKRGSVGLSPFYMRDLMYAATTFGGGGYWAFGPGGILGGLIGSVALGEISRTGYRHLQLANGIESMGSFMKKNATPEGIAKSLNLKQVWNDPKSIGVGKVSLLLTGRSVSRLDDVSDAAVTASPEVAFTGRKDFYDTIDEYGGGENSSNYNHKAVGMKQILMQHMPKKVRDAKGNVYIPENEKVKYLRKLSQSLTPQHFVSAVRNRTLSKEGYAIFKQLYPNFLNKFNTAFYRALGAGLMPSDTSAFYKGMVQDTTTLDLVWTLMSRSQSGQTSKNTPKRKFNKPEPTSSQLAVGGY